MSEVFGSVWGVLTAENEMLSNLIAAPGGIIELYIGFLLFTNILKISYTNKQKYMHIIVLSLSSISSMFLIPTPINVIVNYIIMFIFIKYNLKINTIQTILCILIPTGVFALMGNLILNPILKVLNLTATQLNIIPIYRIIYLCSLYFMCYILCVFLNSIISKRHISIKILDNLDEKSKKIIILNLILGLITIFIQIIITFYYINIYSIVFTLLNFISLFSYFFISFYSLTRNMKLQVTKQDLESAENYNNTLSYLYDNVRAFHHDFDNMLFIIGGFIDNNDIEGLKKYYKNLEKDGERVNELALLNPKTINNSGIYNLLMSKYKKAHISNVEIKLDYFFDFERLKMPIYEFSRILGILLDNAIEAAAESKEKQVKICFRDSSANNTQIISVENTYINKDVDTSIIFEKGETSKTNHTGMGLWEVNQILRKHNNTVLNTSKNENYFKQTLEIYY